MFMVVNCWEGRENVYYLYFIVSIFCGGDDDEGFILVFDEVDDMEVFV